MVKKGVWLPVSQECESGACPEIMIVGKTVFIRESGRPESEIWMSLEGFKTLQNVNIDE